MIQPIRSICCDAKMMVSSGMSRRYIDADDHLALDKIPAGETYFYVCVKCNKANDPKPSED